MSQQQEILERLRRLNSLSSFYLPNNLPNAFIIGPSGSGKSAFISCLRNFKLHIIKIGPTYEIKHNEGENVIGSSMESETQAFFRTEIQDCNVWDTPGYFDSKGAEQNLLFMIDFFQLLKQLRKVKLFLFISKKYLDEQPLLLYKIIEQFVGSFENIKQLQANTFLVFSQISQADFFGYQRRLEQIIQNNQHNIQANNLLNYLLQKRQIMCFPIPETGQFNSQDILWYFKEQLRRIEYTNENLQPKLCFDNSSKDILEQIGSKLEESISNLKNELLIKFCESIELLELNQLNQLRKSTELKIFNLSNNFHAFAAFQTSYEDFKQQQADLEMIYKFLQRDPTCRQQNQLFEEQLQSFVVNFNYKVSIDGKTLIVQAFYLKSSDLQIIGNNYSQSQYQIMKAYCFKFYVDQDLKLIGKNLLIQTYLLFQQGNYLIDLSGVNQVVNRGFALSFISQSQSSQIHEAQSEGSNYQSQNNLRLDIDGFDGENGLDGGDSGNITIVGLYKVIGDNIIEVRLNGGNGADGEDGTDGANGEDGIDADIDGVKQRFKQYEEKMEKITYENNDPSLIEYICQAIKQALLYTNCYRYFYKVEPLAKGSCGGIGGKGGLGGRGGSIGQLQLILTNEDLGRYFKLMAAHGQPGRRGSDGKDGIGGFQGRRCEGIFVDEVHILKDTILKLGASQQDTGAQGGKQQQAAGDQFKLFVAGLAALDYCYNTYRSTNKSPHINTIIEMIELPFLIGQQFISLFSIWLNTKWEMEPHFIEERQRVERQRPSQNLQGSLAQPQPKKHTVASIPNPEEILKISDDVIPKEIYDQLVNIYERYKNNN